MMRLISPSSLRTLAPRVYWRTAATHARSKSTLTDADVAEEEDDATATAAPALTKQGRWAYTFEVMVSKIFPAGFCWQYSSGVAENLGFACDSAAFALTTGAGDMFGVVVGHTGYKIIQSAVKDDVSVRSEVGTALWLGTAAFLAGSSWQPIVNALHDGFGLGFAPTFAGTLAGCGLAFFVGLRAGRAVYPWMEASNSANLKQDFGLSVSIGGATGMFVATDGSFVGAQADALFDATNPIFNIGDADSTLLGCVKAGSSTLTGYGIVNSAQNLVLPAGKNWMDGNNPYC